MKELYKLTTSEVISAVADEIMEEHNVSKKLAKDLVLNALIYYVVIDEIRTQVKFLLECEND